MSAQQKKRKLHRKKKSTRHKRGTSKVVARMREIKSKNLAIKRVFALRPCNKIHLNVNVCEKVCIGNSNKQ